eukprot:gene553-8463_t
MVRAPLVGATAWYGRLSWVLPHGTGASRGCYRMVRAPLVGAATWYGRLSWVLPH